MKFYMKFCIALLFIFCIFEYAIGGPDVEGSCSITAGNASVTEFNCANVSEYTKCARLPDPADLDYLYASTDACYEITDAVVIDDTHWMHYRDKMPVYGTATVLSANPMGSSGYYTMSVDCTVTSPFNAVFGGTRGGTSPTNGASICNMIIESSIYELLGEPATALPGDICPDGFYTVPYETSCGTGLVNIANVPNCSDDTSGEYCLIPAGTPCAAISDCGEISYTNSNGLYTLLYTACDAGMCADEATTLTACGNGYYGDGTSCTPCPTGGVSDTPTWSEQSDGTITFDVVADAMTDCYVEPDTYFTDEKGTYRFRENCTYKD